MYQPVRPAVVDDRLRALREGGPAAVERLIRRVPALAEALVGRGPLVDPYLRRTSKTVDSITRLATLMASYPTVSLVLAHADRIETQLLALAAWHGGLVSRQVAVEETGADPDVLDRAVTGLADLVVVDPAIGWVSLRPGVMECVQLPGRPLRPSAEAYTSADLATILANLGVVAGTRKWERVDALEAALRDPSLIHEVLGRLDRRTLDLFRRVSGSEDGVSSFDPLVSAGEYLQGRQSLARLTSLGLAGFDGSTGFLWVWLDVMVTLRGGLFPEWPGFEPTIRPVEGEHRLPSMPGAVSTLDRVLAQYAAAPVAALRTGGIGVQAVRSTAKGLRLPAPVVGLLTALSVELGLLAPVVTAEKGRGRNHTVEEEWRPTPGVIEWKAQSAAGRWSRLVATWLDSRRLPVDGKPIERYEIAAWDRAPTVARGVFVRALAELEGGCIDRAEFGEWLTYRYPMLLDPGTVAQLLGEATTLGLIEDGPVVAPTPAGAMLLAGAEIEEILSGGPTTFVVQADHSVIAPPDLAGDVSAMLERFAHLESSAGARIYRIDERGITSALDGGVGATEIVAFLLGHSPTGLPQNVERTVLDTAARHGRLQVGSAVTWIACDDPALISAAVAVKAAKLTALSPTSAVSTLARTRVMAALRGAGLAALDTEAADSRPSPWARPPSLPEDGTRRVELFPTDLTALAAGLVDFAELTYEADWDAELDRLAEDM